MKIEKTEIKTFEFTKENLAICKGIIAKYPKGKQASAVVPLLDLAQRQNGGFVSQEVIEYIAKMLEMAPIRVQEVASFYSMINLKPVGKHHIQVCGTTPCWLRGAGDIMHSCKKILKLEGKGDTTSDGQFTLTEVECLGACVDAPVVQINDDYYENLTPQKIEEQIRKLRLS